MSSTIEWTEETWNPVVGCTKVSEGCRNCYAIRQSSRLASMGQGRYAGLTERKGNKTEWTNTVKLVAEVLHKPLNWKRPRMIFVNSMSDLFHEDVPFEFIDEVFAVMAVCPEHTFQILTKRPKRMLEYMKVAFATEPTVICVELTRENNHIYSSHSPGYEFPLSNVWVGVSVENQKTANERIPLLLEIPAAVRWVSYEPALEPVDFNESGAFAVYDYRPTYDFYRTAFPGDGNKPIKLIDGIDWIVIGGESGHGARPFNVDWAEDIINQCKKENVSVFVKQLGRFPYSLKNRWGVKGGFGIHPAMEWKFINPLNDKKGGDINEFPEELRVREYPSLQFEFDDEDGDFEVE